VIRAGAIALIAMGVFALFFARLGQLNGAFVANKEERMSQMGSNYTVRTSMHYAIDWKGGAVAKELAGVILIGFGTFLFVRNLQVRGWK